MGNYLITGYRGTPHVTAADEANIYKSICGYNNSAIVFEDGLGLTINNLNQVSIGSGVGCIQGRMFRVENPINLSIDNVSSGKKRIDLIVAEYKLATDTGVESLDIKVIKGTEATVPTTPTYTSADIDGGASTAQELLYTLEVTPTVINLSKTNYATLKPISDLSAKVDAIASYIKTELMYSYGTDDYRIVRTMSNGIVEVHGFGVAQKANNWCAIYRFSPQNVKRFISATAILATAGGNIESWFTANVKADIGSSEIAFWAQSSSGVFASNASAKISYDIIYEVN